MKIKDLNPPITSGDISFLEFKNLLMNALRIENLDFPTEAFIKSTLIEEGQVGYDKLTNKWALVFGSEVDEIGNPKVLNFRFKNGIGFVRPASYDNNPNGAYLIKAFPHTYSIATEIKRTTDLIDECNKAILQNLKACETPFIAVVKDEDTRYSIAHAIEQKTNGFPVVVVNDSLAEALKGVETRTEFLVDKFATYRDMERDKLFNKLGIMSANINKKERVQVGEVNATTGQCEDYIYTIIDTWNRQMETYGLDFKMSFNGTLEELYTDNANESINENLGEQTND